MKKIIFYIYSAILFNSCVVIYNKENLTDLNKIGSKKNELKTNGYYYSILKQKEYNHYILDENDKYIIDSTKFKEIIKVSPIILNYDGSAFNMPTFTGFQKNILFDFKTKCSLIDNNSLETALKHFECYYKNLPEEKYNFMNKNSEIWGQGVYNTEKKKIKIQTFYNHIGNYYIMEKTGEIINDTTFILKKRVTLRTHKEFKTSEVYHFKYMDSLPETNSFIIRNKQKFKKTKHNTIYSK